VASDKIVAEEGAEFAYGESYCRARRNPEGDAPASECSGQSPSLSLHRRAPLRGPLSRDKYAQSPSYRRVDSDTIDPRVLCCIPKRVPFFGSRTSWQRSAGMWPLLPCHFITFETRALHSISLIAISSLRSESFCHAVTSYCTCT
jgi:hypothetical protein